MNNQEHYKYNDFCFGDCSSQKIAVFSKFWLIFFSTEGTKNMTKNGFVNLYELQVKNRKMAPFQYSVRCCAEY